MVQKEQGVDERGRAACGAHAFTCPRTAVHSSSYFNNNRSRDQDVHGPLASTSGSPTVHHAAPNVDGKMLPSLSLSPRTIHQIADLLGVRYSVLNHHTASLVFSLCRFFLFVGKNERRKLQT